MSKIARSISDLVGKTPIIQLNNIDNNIYAKCEFLNPTSSVKDRVGQNMIEEAILNGRISNQSHIIEPTSGNTGITLASQCAARGLKLTLVMPDSMSIERQKLMKIFGASVVLTPSSKGMQGSIDKAKELKQQYKYGIILDQFSNSSNPAVHETTTAVEILNTMGTNIDIFVASVGTGGTLSGTAKILKEKIPSLQIVAVEPKNSAVLSGESAGIHAIQGIGAGFIPKILNKDIYNSIVKVSDKDAIDTAKLLASKEGLLVGISSGANVWASRYLLGLEENKGKTIVTILCDTAERYLSTELFD